MAPDVEFYDVNDVTTDPVVWLAWGQARGWVSPDFCWTHELPPHLQGEEESLEDDDEPLPCWPAVRLSPEVYEPEEGEGE